MVKKASLRMKKTIKMNPKVSSLTPRKSLKTLSPSPLSLVLSFPNPTVAPIISKINLNQKMNPLIPDPKALHIQVTTNER